MQGKFETQDRIPELSNNLNDTKLPIKLENISVDAAPTKQCRICLASNQTHSNPFISPCECSGSLKFVHKSCLKQWMQTKIQREADDYSAKNEVICQLCKKAVKVSIQLRRECRKPKNVIERIKQAPSVFIVCMIGIIISAAVLVYSIASLKRQVNQGYSKIEPIQKIVILVSIPIEALLMCYFLVSLLKYCISKRATLEFQDNP